ncbi:MAG TPA: phosphatidylserine decarboxylase [Myxococcota bacterium]|nr:phosphatidylserine decarboxylase [Myxococcota bacterium]
MAAAAHSSAERSFVERPTELVVRDGLAFAAAPLALAGACGLLGWWIAGYALLGVALLVACFFRNPPREIAGDEHSVVAPADGRVLEVAQVEGADGVKWLRIGIFLSVFDVHVNRCPLAGRVVAKSRGGRAFRAAFDPRAASENAHCALTLESAGGVRFQVVQIAGWIARRIVCHPEIGEWVRRGDRFGLIRFGSRTDVLLPLGAVPRVKPRDRVRGGCTIVAQLESSEARAMGAVSESIDESANG